MGLIKCPNCEKEISDKSEKCVHCNYELNQKANNKCAECGNEIKENDTVCSKCGCPIENKEIPSIVYKVKLGNFFQRKK